MIYLYYCDNCQAERDVNHGMHEKPDVECSACGFTMHKKPANPSTIYWKNMRRQKEEGRW